MADVESGVVNGGLDQVEEQESREASLERKGEKKPNHQLEWRNLSYSVKKTNFELKPPFRFRLVPFQKQILQSQTGCIKSGEMTALIGPSGAGKTTLLNAITGKCNPEFVSGDVNFLTSSSSEVISSSSGGKFSSENGGKIPSGNGGKILSEEGGGKKLQLRLSYVGQEDFLHQNFTIRETLTFAFRFNLIRTREKSSRQGTKTKVEKLAQDINLTSSLDTKISDCSGGQVKRVSVAVELISNPNILILDEPTTGLDSVNALLMISTMKELLSKKSTFDTFDTNNNQHTPPAVICAIHQPSIEVFKLFHQIYVLSSQGQNVFSGHPSHVSEFLAMNDIVLRPSANPADFLLMLCSSRKGIETMNKRIEELEIEKIGLGRKTSIKVSAAKEESDLRLQTNSNVFSMTSLLLERQVKMLKCNPWPVIIRSVLCLLSTIVMKSIYNHPLGSHNGCYEEIFGLNDPPSKESITVRLFSRNMETMYEESMRRITQVLDNVGYLLFSPTFIIIVHSFMALVETPSEMKIIMKEVSNNWYSVNTYITARMSVSFFIVIFHISSFVWLMSFMSSQQLDMERFFLITLSWILLAWISELTGFMIGAAFHSDLVVAVLIQVYAIFPLMIFSGFFVKPVSFPVVLEKVTYISQLKHVFYATMITVYGKGRCPSMNGNDFTFSEFLKSSPIQTIGRFMETNNITHEASNLISPALGLPDNICLAQVINATRDYLSIPSEFIGTNGTVTNHTIDYEYSMEESSEPFIEREPSFPLSMFGIKEEDLPLCYYSLVTIFLIYLFLTFMTFRIVVTRN